MHPISATGTPQEAERSHRLILAGGAVVAREHQSQGIEVVIIHRARYDDWTLPKGKIETGEPVPVCAVREVREETGVTIRLG
ncbi:MAG TPA: NUDIX domain-containing protein, partial [Propionibacteriaceae bacterium]|nr:NUDIX domain-containing protein [Propionibacteriaceae bacterium]